MKWRIVLTVLFVLTLFAGFAYLYVNTFVRKHQNAVILFVVNGLDLNTLELARQQLGRNPRLSDPDDPAISDARRRSAYRSNILNLDSFWNIALLGVHDSGRPVSDEGADATALACGERVQNGYVGVNRRNQWSLIYAAERANRGPLSEAAIRRLFERILDEARSVERLVMHDEKADSQGHD